ncbi:MAG: outer membrane lipoprotein carrier protein LolA [Candidatus Hydrothermae bacterium]|nr:outer membrane lipoprotein carrier protein LolA [Candidatus Hydrothermae bacterium]
MSLSLALPIRLPMKDGFTVHFQEVVHYPEFGVADTFQGELAFRMPDLLRIVVTAPEPGSIWVKGDTAWILQEGQLQQVESPVPPGLFLLEQADSFHRTENGVVLRYSSRLSPYLDSARLWLNERGVPESLRLWTPEAVFDFRFSSFTPRPLAPAAFRPPVVSR